MMTFALAGNQNCGKTTLFNQLTGSNQHVGNFPGVTVDKKEGVIRDHHTGEHHHGPRSWGHPRHKRQDIPCLLYTSRGIYQVGLPSIIMQSIGSVMVFGMNKILISFTETAVSVFGVYFKLQSFVFMPVFGVTNALIPIVGYNYGARQRKRIMDTIRLGIIMSTAIMALGLVIFQLFPEQLLLLFNAKEDMLSIGVPALRLISLCLSLIHI